MEAESLRSAPAGASERTIVLLVGLVQFVNILDFVMVMPLGPDFAVALGIEVGHLGFLGGTYTAAAGLAGLLGATFLDRFDRRWVLCLSMLGLAIGTAAGALATGLYSLLAARLVAGFFGGPATSSALAIVTDVVPVERRGRAMGAVMGAFSIASIVGVPLGLYAARLGDWRTPFWALGLIGAGVTLGCVALLPPMRSHLERREAQAPFVEILAKPEVRWSYLMTALVMASGFTLIPNISAYVQGNLGLPRRELEGLYMMGGIASFVSMRGAGWLVDKTRPVLAATIGVVGFVFTVATMFIWPVSSVPVFFIVFMTVMALRNVAHQTLASRVPLPAERGRFMSVQSAVGHLAGAAGAIGASQLLVTLPGGKVAHIDAVAWISIALGAAIPFVMWILERRLAGRATATQ